MVGFGKAILVGAAVIVTAAISPSARAATAPADPCSLLTATDVSKSMGMASVALEKTVAPRPYANTVEGTDCHYSPSNGSGEVLFRIYFDPSATEATGLFAKLKLFYSPPTPVTGIGDEAYFDPRHGLHVRKGNVRFFLSFGANTDTQLKDLASMVAGQI
jgi:hypothetical protein